MARSSAASDCPRAYRSRGQAAQAALQMCLLDSPRRGSLCSRSASGSPLPLMSGRCSYFLLVGFRLVVDAFQALGLGALFDAIQLVAPEAFEGLGPFIERANRVGVCSIEHVPSVPAHAHQTYVVQHPQVL